MAYGICGLTPDEFRHMTPAEFDVVLQAKFSDRKRDRRELYRVLDLINCRNCEIVFKAAGAKGIDPNDFRTLEPDNDGHESEERDEMKARRFEETMKAIAAKWKPDGA